MKAAFWFGLLILPVLSHGSDQDEIQHCLRRWVKHPFVKSSPDFRTMATKVKVMGIGDEMSDTRATGKPELVLLKPSVNVLSKSVMSLMNPNGWYCIKGRVDVLGKSEINLHCKAHMASSNDGATVLGSNDSNTGVTVLGKTVVTRLGCEKSKGAESSTDSE